VTTEDFLTSRRRFLAVGGVAGAALLAACTTKSEGAGEATTTTAKPSALDITRLQTASALEELEVALYQHALDGGLVKSAAALDVVKLLQAQHKNHAALFEGHTTRLGGSPATAPNAALLAQFTSRLTDEAAVLRAMYDLAQITAATHQTAVGTVIDNQLNVVFMSVCGVESRHAALIGTMINQPVAAASIATTEKAVR
jgi:hypothetical protein